MQKKTKLSKLFNCIKIQIIYDILTYSRKSCIVFFLFRWHFIFFLYDTNNKTFYCKKKTIFILDSSKKLQLKNHRTSFIIKLWKKISTMFVWNYEHVIFCVELRTCNLIWGEFNLRWILFLSKIKSLWKNTIFFYWIVIWKFSGLKKKSILFITFMLKTMQLGKAGRIGIGW